jgi:hypothetical protein
MAESGFVCPSDWLCSYSDRQAAFLFRLHESEVWQSFYRLVVGVFWALGDAKGRLGGVTGISGGAT